MLQLLIWSVGLASIAWAVLDARFRDAEGLATGKIGLPITLGIALLIFGLGIAGKYLRFAFWLAVALVGQAISLQLIEAGPLIHYQHYKPLNRLVTETNPLLLVFLFAQSVLVVTGLRRRWQDIWGWLSLTFSRWQIAVVGLVFVFSAAALSRELVAYITELGFSAFVQAVNLGTIVLVACSFPEERLAWITQRQHTETVGTRERIDRPVILAALWVTVLAAGLCYFSYQRHPHLADEVAYLQHSRYLAAGLLAMPRPPVPEAFEVYLMEVDGNRWYATPPIGWPIVLAVGALVGLPWLVNPVLAGLNVLLTFLLIREMFDRGVARWVVLLLCVSPWYAFLAMSFMTHTLTLTCALVAALGVVLARKSGHSRWAALAGLAIGLASLIRPLEGLILGGLFAAWAVGIGGRRLKLSSIAALLVGMLAVGSLVLPYNRLLTGDPKVHPIMAYTDKHFGVGTNALGFGPNRGLRWPLDPFPGHSPLDAAVNANLNIFSLNVELFGWSIGSLLLITLFLLSGTLKTNDYLMVAAIAAVFVAHAFYWYSGGPDFGARYWFLMLVPLVVLTARGIKYLQSSLTPEGGAKNLRGARVTLGVLILCALAVINYFPWRAVDKYHHYLGMRPDIRFLTEDLNLGRSLVLIRGEQFPDYSSAFAYNPIDLHSDAPVYVWDRDPNITQKVLQSYSDRPVWIVNGPSITHRGYEVIAGPLPATTPIAALAGSR